MKTRPIHWSEGMFILPHHFQAADSFALDTLSNTMDWRLPHGYGLREFSWNPESLANLQVRIHRLRARMRDGSLVSVPENANLSPLDLKPALEKNSDVYILLALPEMIAGRPNASRNGADGGQRFVVVSEDWEDRNAGGNPRSIETQRLNARLFASPSIEGPQGYETLPILKLKRSASAESAVELDLAYIPPLLTCDAWSELRQGILGSITDRLGAFIRSQAEFLRLQGGWTEANQPQIRREIMKLHAVNGAYPYLLQLLHVGAVHPFLAYTELCRLVGQLALFRDDWTPPELPDYDHDDLGTIFRAVNRELSLEQSRGPQRQSFPFMGVQDWMEVSLDPRWLRGNFQFYVAVHSDFKPEHLDRLFSHKWLHWKLGSSRDILRIYRNAEAGLQLERVVGVHPHLPARANVTYFRVETRGPHWDEVVDMRSLALKVNETYVRGDFGGQSTITVIDPKNQPHDLKLELFLVENE